MAQDYLPLIEAIPNISRADIARSHQFFCFDNIFQQNNFRIAGQYCSIIYKAQLCHPSSNRMAMIFEQFRNSWGIKTFKPTMIYLHVLKNLEGKVISPLEKL